MTILREDAHPFLRKAAAIIGRPIWGWKPSIEPAPYCGDDIVVRPMQGGLVAIGYLAHDSSPSDFWNADNGDFKEFRDAWSRDEWVEQKRAEGLTVYVVDKYDHGQVHYSIANTAPYPDRQWDVAPRAALACDFAAWGTPDNRQVAVANSILDEYSMWCNGEVYGVVIVALTIDAETGEVTHENEDITWGLIGGKTAGEALLEYMPDATVPA